MSVSIRLVQLLHDGVKFFPFRLPGRLLLDLLESLHFNVSVEADYSVVLTLEAFRWIFIHVEGVFVHFEVVST